MTSTVPPAASPSASAALREMSTPSSGTVISAPPSKSLRYMKFLSASASETVSTWALSQSPPGARKFSSLSWMSRFSTPPSSSSASKSEAEPVAVSMERR